eukprot:1151401-Pelagomonas_calceolata.AAC.6
MPSQMPSQMLQHAGRKAPGVQQLASAQAHPGLQQLAGLDGCRGGGRGGGGGEGQEGSSSGDDWFTGDENNAE